MGFFSYLCKTCGKSIRSHYANDGHEHWMSDAVVVLKDDSDVGGEYDGYGRIGEDAFELPDDPADFTIWHRACWDANGKPEIFSGPAKRAQDQGYFCGEVLTLFPPGHDPVAVERRHTEEILNILDEIKPVLNVMYASNDDYLSTLIGVEAISQDMRARHAKHMVDFRAQLDAELTKKDGAK